MDEAEICNKVAVIDHGKIIAHDTPFNLKKQFTKDRAYVTTTNPQALEKLLDAQKINYIKKEKYHRIDVDNKAELLHILSDCRDDITDIEIRKGTLNDVFLEITGREIRQGGENK
jgi:ABC-2 type transport system ATP-binding protein